MKRPILTLDTSGINWLADDLDSDALMAGLTAGFHPRITFTSLSEVVQNQNPKRRRALLRICKFLLASGDCIDPQHEIIRKMVVACEESPSFDWRAVAVDFPEARAAIGTKENIHDELAEQEREEARTLEKQFIKTYDDAKPAFDRLFQGDTETKPASVDELVKRLQIPGGTYWSIGERLYSRVGKLHPDESSIHRFTVACPRSTL